MKRLSSLKDVDDPILEWLEFIDSDSKEGMEMLAERNENIKVAYEILQRVSRSKEARAAYDARQAEIMDQMTREKSAIDRTKIEIARNLIGVLDIEVIAEKTSLSIEIVKSLM